MVTDIRNQPDYHQWILWILGGLTVLRILMLLQSPLGLHGDEAQYWAWSRSLEWGYFSKPPMIAWLIGATTAIFGNAEWAIRLSSPLIHPLTAYVLFRTGRFLFDARTGFFAACLYFFMPAVWLSSAIASTDVALLLFWSLALNTWVHFRETTTVKGAVLLGIFIGLGMLSKYAMLFFVISLALIALFDEKSRKALLSKFGVLAALLALLIMSPNIAWNAANDFQTVGHTAANANLKGVPFHPSELLEFIGSQFAVFGPLTFALLLAVLGYAIKRNLNPMAHMLAVFTFVPLFVICVEALLSRANANWAVTSYIGGCLLAAYFIATRAPKLGKAGIWINIALGTTMAILALSPSLTNAAGLANSVKRMRGWPATIAQITEIAEQGHEGQAFSAIAADKRLVFFNLTYYGVEEKSGVPLRSWLYSKHIHNHAEATQPLVASTIDDGPVLIVNYFKNYEKYFKEDFERLEKLAPLTIELGGGKTRTYFMWAGYGYTPTQTYR
jgi:4-amino-4-deoxy-L-arabinose transferase-like glycosyltransferase